MILCDAVSLNVLQASSALGAPTAIDHALLHLAIGPRDTSTAILVRIGTAIKARPKVLPYSPAPYDGTWTPPATMGVNTRQELDGRTYYAKADFSSAMADRRH